MHPAERMNKHLEGVERYSKMYDFLPVKISCVYIIRCIENGSVYIGETDNFIRRFAQHITELKAKTHHNWKLQKDFDKYGVNNFYFKCVTDHIYSVQERQWTESDFIIKAKKREINNKGVKIYNIKIPKRDDIGYEFKQTFKDE